jgi:DNA-directed RNA polymerase specialized sigma24 family protein
MLKVNKIDLNKEYNKGDMNYFFKEAEKITDFILSRNYNVYDPEKRADMTQECLLNLWKKIEQGKVDGSKNLMSFVWKNSTYRILEMFRKENNRNRIVKFVSYDDIFVDKAEKNQQDKYI